MYRIVSLVYRYSPTLQMFYVSQMFYFLTADGSVLFPFRKNLCYLNLWPFRGRNLCLHINSHTGARCQFFAAQTRTDEASPIRARGKSALLGLSLKQIGSEPPLRASQHPESVFSPNTKWLLSGRYRAVRWLKKTIAVTGDPVPGFSTEWRGGSFLLW